MSNTLYPKREYAGVFKEVVQRYYSNYGHECLTPTDNLDSDALEYWLSTGLIVSHGGYVTVCDDPTILELMAEAVTEVSNE